MQILWLRDLRDDVVDPWLPVQKEGSGSGLAIGSVEWTRYGVRPAMDGTAQTVTRGKSSYKLP